MVQSGGCPPNRCLRRSEVCCQSLPVTLVEFFNAPHIQAGRLDLVRHSRHGLPAPRCHVPRTAKSSGQIPRKALGSKLGEDAIGDQAADCPRGTRSPQRVPPDEHSYKKVATRKSRVKQRSGQKDSFEVSSVDSAGQRLRMPLVGPFCVPLGRGRDLNRRNPVTTT
jgi:hypothetical protein